MQANYPHLPHRGMSVASRRGPSPRPTGAAGGRLRATARSRSGWPPGGSTGRRGHQPVLAGIVRANVLTRFNAILGALLVVILTVGLIQDALGVVLVTNAGIGIYQEWRAKRTLDRLTLVTAPVVTVARAGERSSPSRRWSTATWSSCPRAPRSWPTAPCWRRTPWKWTSRCCRVSRCRWTRRRATRCCRAAS